MESWTWRRVEPILEAALLVNQNERSALLERACGDDECLRREVESFLDYEAEAERFMAAAPELNPTVNGDTAQPEASPVSPGSLVAPYRVDGPLGAGGMGEVGRGIQGH